MIRIALIVIYGMFPSGNIVMPLVILLLLPLLFLLAVFHPYKSPNHNIVNIFVLFIE